MMAMRFAFTQAVAVALAPTWTIAKANQLPYGRQGNPVPLSFLLSIPVGAASTIPFYMMGNYFPRIVAFNPLVAGCVYFCSGAIWNWVWL